LVKRSWLAGCTASLALAATLGAAPASAGPVVNGGFETGDFTGWTLTGDSSNSFVVSDLPVPQSGTFGASFGPVGTTGGIMQTLTTIAGANYVLDFWLQAEPDPFGAATPNSFLATWGGTTVTSLVDSPAFGYVHEVFSVTATSASTDLGFTFRNDPAFWDLDNVSVTAVSAVPEPETLALVGLGLAVLAAQRRRRRAPQ
jgi:PEP-CTERM motif